MVLFSGGLRGPSGLGSLNVEKLPWSSESEQLFLEAFEAKVRSWGEVHPQLWEYLAFQLWLAA